MSIGRPEFGAPIDNDNHARRPVTPRRAFKLLTAGAADAARVAQEALTRLYVRSPPSRTGNQNLQPRAAAGAGRSGQAKQGSQPPGARVATYTAALCHEHLLAHPKTATTIEDCMASVKKALGT
jgi:hypothetical protein